MRIKDKIQLMTTANTIDPKYMKKKLFALASCIMPALVNGLYTIVA